MTRHSALSPLPRGSAHVSVVPRLYGLGSVFGKTLRDSRISALAVAAVVGLTVFAGGEAMASTYGTATSRLELARYAADLPPAMRGLYGDPVAVDTVDGFVSWHYGRLIVLMVGLCRSSLSPPRWRARCDGAASSSSRPHRSGAG